MGALSKLSVRNSGILNRKILSLALPFLAANISIPLLGLVDTAVLGHLESEKYLGAIALGGMIFNFIFWGFSFLKMGTTGFTAQARGRGDKTNVSVILQRGIYTGIAIGLLIVALRNLVWWVSSHFLQGSQEIIFFAEEYFSIRVFSAPAVFMLYVITGWFLGMQNALFVLYITITENIANIIFNLIFIFVFEMRADGVALGTVCAQYLALGIALILLFAKYKHELKLHAFRVLMNLKELAHYFRINSDIMIRTLTLMFAFAFFTVKSSSFDDVLLASNMILLQFMIFFSYVIDGLAHAGESLSGYFFGARKERTLKILIQRLFFWSALLAMLFSLIYISLFRDILSLLTNQQSVIETAVKFKWWLVAIPVISFSAFVWDGIFIGLTATKQLRNAMLLSMFCIYLPLFYIIEPVMGNHALWFSMCAFLFARGAFLWLFSKKLIAIRT